MKRMMTIALLSAALAGCGEGSALNDTVQISVRESLVVTCTTAAGEQIPEGIDVDIGTVCACAADKVMDGQSVSDLVTNPPSPTEAMSKVQACLQELGPVKIDAAA
ncbi:hypothetical protein [Sphingorhabdus sp. EL138]|uniref:hypothetical protein n=1 Tax=Sphingorhabdus sp. EL138 TaxID=2073156 RepID=UPI0025D6AFAF|nr:hypothetical protein [Sphingorhabdus sp. EL138]